MLALLSSSTGVPLFELSSVGWVLLTVRGKLLLEQLVLGTSLPGSLELLGRVGDPLLEPFPRSTLERRGQTGQEVGRRLLRGAVESHVYKEFLRNNEGNDGQRDSD